MFRHDPQRTGRSDRLGPDRPTISWEFRTGGAISSSAAVGGDGTIYVGSFDGDLYALAPDGEMKWRYATGARIESSPAIAADGTIYVGSYDGDLYAIRADGTLRWRFATGSRGLSSSPAIASDGTIYIGGSSCCLYAVGPDGARRWKASTDAGVFSSPAIGPDGTIYVGSNDFHLYAFRPDGSQKWRSSFLFGAVSSSPAVAADGTIYVGTVHPFGSGGELLAVAPDGTLRWHHEFSQPMIASPALATDGTVEAETMDGHLYALDPAGAVRSSTRLAGISSPLIAGDGTVYAGAFFDGALVRIGPGGRVEWAEKMGEHIAASPSLGPDGTLYVGGYDGVLYAVGRRGGPPITRGAPPAPAPTPAKLPQATPTTASVCDLPVYVESATLMRCGRPFRFIGAVDQTILAPYLGLSYGPWYWAGVADPAARLADAAASGISVIRFLVELGDFDGIGYVGDGVAADCMYCGRAFDAFWSAYTKEPDHRTFFAAFDRLVADAKRYGLYLEPDLLVCYACWSKVGGGSDLFTVGSPADEAWKGFLRTVATHYQGEPQILWWGLTGEGNNVIAGDTYTYGGRPIAPDQVVRWADDAYDALKAADPRHLVAGGWNMPWSGYGRYYGGGEAAHDKVVSEYRDMAYFRALNEHFDVATLHLYDADIYNDEEFIGVGDLRGATAALVEHYAREARDVLHKPFYIDETGGKMWSFTPFRRIGYSPSPFVEDLLEAVARYPVAGAIFWGWEEDVGEYYISPDETPEIVGWFKRYAAILAKEATTSPPPSASQALVAASPGAQRSAGSGAPFPTLLAPAVVVVGLVSALLAIALRRRNKA